MADIDLIPQSYRDYVDARRTVCRTAAALAAVMSIALAVGGVLQWQLRGERNQLSRMQEQTSDVAALKTRVDAKKGELLRRENAANALAMLRGTGEAAKVFRAMELSLHDDVMLTRITFSRAYRVVEPGSALTGSRPAEVTGQSIAGNANQGVQAWLMPARLELQGEAADHAALAAFIDVASRAPGITEVRFQSSTRQEGEVPHGIEFSVEAKIGKNGAAL